MSLKNWSRIGAVTLVGGMVALGAATPAYAAPGDASGTALDIELEVSALGVPLLGTDVTLASSVAPPNAADAVIDLSASVLPGLGVAADAGVLTASADSQPTISEGSAGVTGLDLSILTAGITADAISGAASCPAGGGATTASTITNLDVFGTAIDLGDLDVDAGADLDVLGLASARLVATVDTDVSTTSATTATVTALQVTLALETQLLPISPVVSVPVGTISLGTASCESPLAAAVTPTATGLLPGSGPDEGNTTVTVTGTGFVQGTTSVTIGTTVVPAASVTVTSPTTLTFVTPAGTPGAAPVTVTNTPGGTSTPALSFVYLADPTISGLNPTSGPDQGGTSVTVSGTGFVPGQTTVSIGSDTGIVPTAVTGTSLTFVTPGDPAGLAPVSVVTPGGTSAPSPFTYVADPTLTGIAPNSGPVAGGTTVTLTGSNFIAGATTVTVDGAVVTPNVVSATSLTFATPAHAAGLVDVTVTTPSGTSGPLGFTYLDAPVVGAPTATDLATDLAPDTGSTAGGTTVTVDGTGFVPGTTVTVDGVPATGVTVLSPTELTGVTPAGDAGLVVVVVTTPAGSAAPLGFTYVAAAAPVASSLTPAVGPTTGGTTVTVAGSGFVAGQTTVTIGGVTVPATAVTVTSPTSLTFVTPAHAAGAVPVTVTVPAGTSAPLGFTYQAVAPTATNPDPGSGPTTGGTTVTVDGTGFVPGGTTVTVDGKPVAVTVVSPTRLTFVTPAHAAGVVTVRITTDGGSVDVAFRYVAGAGAANLASTGVDTAVPLVGGLGVLLVGTGLLVASRRRRTEG